MKMHVDPDRIEELGRQLKNFSYNIEDMYQYVYNMVTRLVETVEAKYHESYVRANTRALKEALGRLRNNTETAYRNLQDLAMFAINSASGYREKEYQIAKAIAQGSLKFSINLSVQKALSNRYKVTNALFAPGILAGTIGTMGLKLSTSNSKRQLSMSVSQPVSAVNLSAQSPNAAEGNIKVDKKSGKETELPPVYSPNSTYVVGNMIIDKKTGRAIEASPGYNPNSLVVGNVIIDKKTGKAIVPEKQTQPASTTSPQVPGKPANYIAKIEDLEPKKGFTQVYVEEIQSVVSVYITDPSKETITFGLGEEDKRETLAQLVKGMQKEIPVIAAANAGFFDMSGPLSGDFCTEHHGLILVNGKELVTDQYSVSNYGPGVNNHDYFVERANTFIYYTDGRTEIRKISVNDIDSLREEAHWAIGAGYVLVKDGKIPEVHAGWYDPEIKTARTLFGARADGSFIIVTVDGRGVDAKESSQIMMELGAVNAINFDGGGSTGMWYDGKIVSQNTGRKIGTAVFVVPK